MYTLQDFMTDLPVEDLKILARPADFSTVHVNSISVQELPLDAFVREHEVILSTLIGCLEDDDVLCQFLRDIKQSRAAALITCFKDPAYRLSQRAMDCAQNIGLPILSIPWEVRFAEVIHFTTQRIHEKNIEGYKRTQDQLFNAYFTSQTLDDAARILARFFDSPVAIAGKNTEIKGRSSGQTPNETCALLDIRINTFLWGYLYICEPDKCASLLAERELLEKYISLPLTLWFNKENIEDMMVLKMKNDFVWNLANKNYTSFLEMAQQGAKLGFDLAASHMCIAFRICSHDPDGELNEYSARSAELTSDMEDLIIAERKRRRLNIMFADRGLLFLVFAEVAASTSTHLIEEFVTSLDFAFTEAHPYLRLYWGMSGISPENSEQFHKLSQNAQLALRYCMNARDAKRIFTYKDTQFHQIVSELSCSENIKAAARETLDPLVIYDKTSSMDLLGTLMEFIRNNGNSSQTARSLHLNRQSLLYRLKKIESMTGMSLSQRRDLFLLELFTRIHSDY